MRPFGPKVLVLTCVLVVYTARPTQAMPTTTTSQSSELPSQLHPATTKPRAVQDVDTTMSLATPENSTKKGERFMLFDDNSVNQNTTIELKRDSEQSSGTLDVTINNSGIESSYIKQPQAATNNTLANASMSIPFELVTQATTSDEPTAISVYNESSFPQTQSSTNLIRVITSHGYADGSTNSVITSNTVEPEVQEGLQNPFLTAKFLNDTATTITVFTDDQTDQPEGVSDIMDLANHNTTDARSQIFTESSKTSFTGISDVTNETFSETNFTTPSTLDNTADSEVTATKMNENVTLETTTFSYKIFSDDTSSNASTDTFSNDSLPTDTMQSRFTHTGTVDQTQSVTEGASVSQTVAVGDSNNITDAAKVRVTSSFDRHVSPEATSTVAVASSTEIAYLGGDVSFTAASPSDGMESSAYISSGSVASNTTEIFSDNRTDYTIATATELGRTGKPSFEEQSSTTPEEKDVSATSTEVFESKNTSEVKLSSAPETTGNIATEDASTTIQMHLSRGITTREFEDLITTEGSSTNGLDFTSSGLDTNTSSAETANFTMGLDILVNTTTQVSGTTVQPSDPVGTVDVTDEGNADVITGVISDSVTSIITDYSTQKTAELDSTATQSNAKSDDLLQTDKTSLATQIRTTPVSPTEFSGMQITLSTQEVFKDTVTKFSSPQSTLVAETGTSEFTGTMSTLSENFTTFDSFPTVNYSFVTSPPAEATASSTDSARASTATIELTVTDITEQKTTYVTHLTTDEPLVREIKTTYLPSSRITKIPILYTTPTKREKDDDDEEEEDKESKEEKEKSDSDDEDEEEEKNKKQKSREKDNEANEDDDSDDDEERKPGSNNRNESEKKLKREKNCEKRYAEQEAKREGKNENENNKGLYLESCID